MQESFKRIRASLDGHRSAPSDDTSQPPPHWNQGLESTTDAQSDCELDIFHLVTGFTVGNEESPACLKQMEEGGKCYKAEEHVQLTRGGRRYSWDIPPDESGQTVTVDDGIEHHVGGKKFSWDKPPNLNDSDYDAGSVSFQCIGGKSYRWDSYRAPSLGEFVNMEV